MALTDVENFKTLDHFLKPEDILSLHGDIRNKITEQQDLQTSRKSIGIDLDTMRGRIINSPDFKAEKNQALQENLWRNMFPDEYRALDAVEAELLSVDQELHLLREKAVEYRMLIDYFTALK